MKKNGERRGDGDRDVEHQTNKHRISQTLGTGIDAYIDPPNHPNVGKYGIQV